MAKIKRPYGYASGKQKMDDAEANYQSSIEDFEQNGNVQMGKADKYDFENMQDSAMGKVATDPALREAQMAALQDLRDRSKSGMTLRDKADLAAIQDETNAANRGRQDALKQEFAARGQGGGGASEAVMRMQAMQSAQGRAGRGAQEVAARAESNRMNATQAMGAMSGSMRDQEFNEQAAKAQAADRINQYNNAGRNNATQAQWGENAGRDRINNQNSTNFQQNKLQANQAGAQFQYNSGAEQENARRLAEQERQRQKKAKSGSILGAVGGAAGAYFGGPAGASAGYAAGSALGNSFAHGGKVEGPEVVSGDHPANDVIPATLSANEIVLPKTVAQDGEKAKQFVDSLNGEPSQSTEEIVGALFSTLGSLLSRKR